MIPGLLKQLPLGQQLIPSSPQIRRTNQQSQKSKARIGREVPNRVLPLWKLRFVRSIRTSLIGNRGQLPSQVPYTTRPRSRCFVVLPVWVWNTQQNRRIVNVVLLRLCGFLWQHALPSASVLNPDRQFDWNMSDRQSERANWIASGQVSFYGGDELNRRIKRRNNIGRTLNSQVSAEGCWTATPTALHLAE